MAPTSPLLHASRALVIGLVALSALLVGTPARAQFICHPPDLFRADDALNHSVPLHWVAPPSCTPDGSAEICYANEPSFRDLDGGDSLLDMIGVRFSPGGACSLLSARVYVFPFRPEASLMVLRFFNNSRDCLPDTMGTPFHADLPLVIPDGTPIGWYTVDLRPLHIYRSVGSDFWLVLQKTDTSLAGVHTFVLADTDGVTHEGCGARSVVYSFMADLWSNATGDYGICARIRRAGHGPRRPGGDGMDDEVELTGSDAPPEPVAGLEPRRVVANPLAARWRMGDHHAPGSIGLPVDAGGTPLGPDHALTEGLLYYRMYRATDSATGSYSVYGGHLLPTDTNFTDTAVTNGYTYCYKLQGVFDSTYGGDGPLTDAACATPRDSGYGVRDTICMDDGITDSAVEWARGFRVGNHVIAPGPCKLLGIRVFLTRTGLFRVGYGLWNGTGVDEGSGGSVYITADRAAVAAGWNYVPLPAPDRYVNKDFVVFQQFYGADMGVGYEPHSPQSFAVEYNPISGTWHDTTGTYLVCADVEYQNTLSFVSLRRGWNLVSVPVRPSSASVGAAFPGAISVFGQDPTHTSYVVPSDIAPQFAYWVLSGADTNYQLSGIPVSEITATMTSGWNMVGSTAHWGCIRTTAIESSPVGAYVPSLTYRYVAPGGGYVPSSEDCAGVGYWMFSTSPGSILIAP